MHQLFRQSKPGLSGYVSLLAFAIVYLAAIALVIAPEHLLSVLGATLASGFVP